MPPRIESYRFGSIVVDGKTYTSDLIIFPERVAGSWWRQQGHSLAPDDLEEVVEAAPEVLIIGQGAVGRMEVPSDTLAYLEASGIKVIADQTGEACRLYNQMCDSRRVVAALHLTC
jgi:hypothetical protein